MGYTGLISFSIDPKIIADLAFFKLMLLNDNVFVIVSILVLALALTLSTIDTLINAISSIVVVDGKKIYSKSNQKDYLKLSKFFVVFLSLISFIIASKGFSILYLFLLADLLCCSAVFTIFYGFYQKKLDERKAMKSILLGLFFGLLIFPSPDFSKSILIGTLLPFDFFPQIISSSLLFWSFLIATLGPALVIMRYDSFKR